LWKDLLENVPVVFAKMLKEAGGYGMLMNKFDARGVVFL